ncbi:MAG: Xaa-Pro peptidase family protein [Pirellulales bacterium]
MPDDPFPIDREACRGRQRRLLAALEPLDVDATLLTRRESVQWVTGVCVRPPFEPVALITGKGHVTLVMPEHLLDETAAADDILGYDAKWHATTRDDQRFASALTIEPKLPKALKQVACEFEAFAPSLLIGLNAPLVEIDSVLFELRRRKDADELRLMAKANEANRAMYEQARRIVRPGLNELELFGEMHRVAVDSLGEAPTYFGQDFRFSHPGGPPRDRVAQAGEILILDLGVGFRGYHSDNARAIAVDGAPTADQLRAWETVQGVFDMIASEAKPGCSCRRLYDLAYRQLNRRSSWTFNHHLGHGVGLAPHEGPHLNPYWDDILAEGDFLAVEPGVYHESLRAGVRLEQNYLVTGDGVQLITDWPLELTATL